VVHDPAQRSNALARNARIRDEGTRNPCRCRARGWRPSIDRPWHRLGLRAWTSTLSRRPAVGPECGGRPAGERAGRRGSRRTGSRSLADGRRGASLWPAVRPGQRHQYARPARRRCMSMRRLTPHCSRATTASRGPSNVADPNDEVSIDKATAALGWRADFRVHLAQARTIPHDATGLSLPRQRTQRRSRIGPFGFSWPSAVSSQKPPIIGVGFVWISLDSLVRIETYQWVTQDKPQKFFSLAFSAAAAAPQGARAVLARGSAGSLMRQAYLIF
jgi:hypothetical protein